MRARSHDILTQVLAWTALVGILFAPLFLVHGYHTEVLGDRLETSGEVTVGIAVILRATARRLMRRLEQLDAHDLRRLHARQRQDRDATLRQVRRARPDGRGHARGDPAGGRRGAAAGPRQLQGGEQAPAARVPGSGLRRAVPVLLGRPGRGRTPDPRPGHPRRSPGRARDLAAGRGPAARRCRVAPDRKAGWRACA